MSKTRIFNGSRFLFIEPGEKPAEIQVKKDNDSETVIIKEPTIFSKIKTNLAVNKFQHFNPVFSTSFTLATIVTDRKVYTPKDEVRLFVFAPQKAGQVLSMMIIRNGQELFKEEFETDEQGIYFNSLKNLDDGSYSIEIKLNDNENISCSFTVAQYTLSFLRASLVSHDYKDGTLGFRLLLIQGDIPYKGKVTVGLFCGYCDVVVANIETSSKEGTCEGSFLLEGHTGPFKLVITTHSGESATLSIPGSSADVRDSVSISHTGEIVEASLLPSQSLTRRTRGIYMGSTGTKTSPVILEDIIGETAKLNIAEDLHHLMICIYSPIDDKYQEIEKRDVKKGDVIEFNTPYPFSLLSVASMGNDCYENFSFLMKPERMELEIEAPEKSLPGEEIDITITSNRNGKLMLVIADSRLERENPLDKLAEVTFKNIKKNLSQLKPGKVGEFFPAPRGADGRFLVKTRRVGGSTGNFDIMNAATSFFHSKPDFSGLQNGINFAFLDEVDIKEKTFDEEIIEGNLQEDDKLSMTRLDFPQVILAEIVDFDERLEKKIKLGEQIGAFTIFAFLIDKMDFTSTTHKVETSREVYVELDVPSLMSPGDEITGRAYARCPDTGELSVRTPITSVTDMVNKHGVFEIPIKSAGEVMAELECPQGKDATGKTIMLPGKEKITTSKLIWLKPGESIKAGRIIVYPGPGNLMKDSVDSLIRYPFGCAEQTSSKLYGLALVYRAMEKGVIANGNSEVKRMIQQGAHRMEIFYREDGFCLWEKGKADISVTMQVLSNLKPLWKMNVQNIDEMIENIIEKLLKKKTRDNCLVYYDEKFSGKMKTVRDAVTFYNRGIEKEKAVKLIKNKVKRQGSMAYWEDETCWAGTGEATCLALQVAYHEMPGLFVKGFNYVSSKLKDGRLYSTSDTCAFLELLNQLSGITTREVIIDGETHLLTGVLIGKEVTAVDKTLVRIDEESEVDYLSPRSDFEGELKIERTSLKLGEKVNLSIQTLEDSIAPLVRIYLPGNLASLKGGTGIQKMYLPVRESPFSLELYGIRRGKGKLRVVLHDMYNEEKVGVLPGLTIRVS